MPQCITIIKNSKFLVEKMLNNADFRECEEE
jgi:hypothetical protein